MEPSISDPERPMIPDHALYVSPLFTHSLGIADEVRGVGVSCRGDGHGVMSRWRMPLLLRGTSDGIVWVGIDGKEWTLLARELVWTLIDGTLYTVYGIVLCSVCWSAVRDSWREEEERKIRHPASEKSEKRPEIPAQPIDRATARMNE